MSSELDNRPTPPKTFFDPTSGSTSDDYARSSNEDNSSDDERAVPKKSESSGEEEEDEEEEESNQQQKSKKSDSSGEEEEDEEEEEGNQQQKSKESDSSGEEEEDGNELLETDKSHPQQNQEDFDTNLDGIPMDISNETEVIDQVNESLLPVEKMIKHSEGGVEYYPYPSTEPSGPSTGCVTSTMAVDDQTTQSTGVSPSANLTIPPSSHTISADTTQVLNNVNNITEANNNPDHSISHAQLLKSVNSLELDNEKSPTPEIQQSDHSHPSENQKTGQDSISQTVLLNSDNSTEVENPVSQSTEPQNTPAKETSQSLRNNVAESIYKSPPNSINESISHPLQIIPEESNSQAQPFKSGDTKEVDNPASQTNKIQTALLVNTMEVLHTDHVDSIQFADVTRSPVSQEHNLMPRPRESMQRIYQTHLNTFKWHDHHQLGFDETYPTSHFTKLSSTGLIYNIDRESLSMKLLIRVVNLLKLKFERSIGAVQA
ncbi:Hypothetical protein MELLADRAFT_105483 [Melampsora larici-populina 98AG31]|uniref:Uncharacterized protein n=1 Tax=Melampsora larici-populina (strain 98AG31 / pathotype 3-4-7) TaxID=747676 RepID=F4RIA0_MELLP|nr:Hypothetical protein MELLADRAFT_105483 [Melampsora larici-populina 98AG31]EGG08004.1 Hypothetical protein MELLADRAFT_105483 [Melampsora larici-populina 98AG31]